MLELFSYNMLKETPKSLNIIIIINIIKMDNNKDNICLICGYKWGSRVTIPAQCPKCKRYDWNEPKNNNPPPSQETAAEETTVNEGAARVFTPETPINSTAPSHQDPEV